MRKDLFNKFACFSGVVSPEPKEIEVPDYVMDESDLMRVINEIFSVDERTGQPMGDLAYFMSPNGNPTVKAWLENNLLKPRFGEKMHDEKITDDLMVEMSRGADESLDDFGVRLAGLRDAAMEEYQKSLESKSD